MITILERIFINPDMDDNRKRGIYGTLCGVVGIFLNLLLFIGKFLAGVLSNSIAITADAFNNLSDAGSSVMTLIGFRLASQKPDLKHPFGHGRMEYLAGLGVSALILIMGVELLQTSVGKIIHPTDTEFSPLIGGILIVSILVKCYMAYYNRNVGRKIGSATIEATATDSLSDCVATGVVLLSGIIGHFTNLRIDGYCGALVGLFICYAGINAAKETINPLLGQAPEPEFVEQIQQIVMGYDENILGMHDLIVHDYGPGRRMISLHAEVPAGGDILKLHDEIDNLELSNGSKIVKLTGSNNFVTKLLLEKEDTETSYIVYAPFARPEDKENSLVDIFYYSEHFYSDKLVQLMGDLNIPPECQDEVKQYKKFWSGGNLQKFQPAFNR